MKNSQAKKAFNFSPLTGLRLEIPADDEYLLNHGSTILDQPAFQEYSEVRGLLNKEGVSITPMSKRLGRFGFLAENLGVGVIDGRRQREISNIGVVGVCLPQRINLQTIMPLMVARDLVDQGLLEKIYVALPLAGYGIADLPPRYNQYRQVVGFIYDMFRDDLDRVVLMPDDKLLGLRSATALIVSRSISDVFAKRKYPFGNLFAYSEVAGYGADVVLPALAEQKDVVVVSDFMQYESLHAGFQATNQFGFDMSAIMLPLLSPKVEKGKLVQVSHLNEESFEEHSCPEISPVFLAGLLTMSRDESIDKYIQAKQGKKTEDLINRVRILQSHVANLPLISNRLLQDFEDKSLPFFDRISDIVSDKLARKIRGRS